MEGGGGLRCPEGLASVRGYQFTAGACAVFAMVESSMKTSPYYTTCITRDPKSNQLFNRLFKSCNSSYLNVVWVRVLGGCVQGQMSPKGGRKNGVSHNLVIWFVSV